jgi:hypothetical protein
MDEEGNEETALPMCKTEEVNQQQPGRREPAGGQFGMPDSKETAARQCQQSGGLPDDDMVGTGGGMPDGKEVGVDGGVAVSIAG